MAEEKITKEKFEKVIDLYFLWKELNGAIKEISTRGINLPEALTESICCYVNGFYRSTGKGSEDAIDTLHEEYIQIKATSNFTSDSTTFGPKSTFSQLHFVRLNQVTDMMYLYNIPTELLQNLYVNKNDTFQEQQNQGRRPRFSIIKRCIVPYSILEYAVIDLTNKSIQK